ncbi:MAG: hypothetical protein ABSA58_24635 [Acetobacteraceae bacterium]
MTDWFAADAFVPHGFCLSWDPNLMATIVLSNALIALAYLVISVVLVNQAIQPRPAVPRLLYWTFAAFIFCCGVSHVLDDVTLWLPIYRLQAVVLGVTAFVSLLTAVLPVSIWVRREADRSRRERG